MDKVRQEVLKDFRPVIEREVQYRKIVNRFIKLGCSDKIDYSDFREFFNIVCKLYDELDTVAELRELKSIVTDSEFIFGGTAIKNVQTYIKYVD